MLRLHSSPSRIPIPPPVSSLGQRFPTLVRQSAPCPCWWINSSDLHVGNLPKNNRGQWEANFRRTFCELDSPMSMNISDNFQANDSRLHPKYGIIGKQGLHVKLLIASISSYFILRMLQLDFVNRLIKVAQDILFSMAAKTSPFACMSTSLNKPTPLRLDVSLPSLRDISWSLARLLYLFNLQLERNVATFFIVLLALCFSFVLIGGFLFFKFR